MTERLLRLSGGVFSPNVLPIVLEVDVIVDGRDNDDSGPFDNDGNRKFELSPSNDPLQQESDSTWASATEKSA